VEKDFKQMYVAYLRVQNGPTPVHQTSSYNLDIIYGQSA